MSDENIRRVTAFIFDLDGTLIDSKRDLIRSVNAMLHELKRAELTEETISTYIGHGAPRLVARALGDDSSEEEQQRALKFFLEYYEEHKMDTTCAYPEVVETLELLKGMPMAVLTNKPKRISVRILNELDLAKYFLAIYGGNSFETKKPDPLGAKTILRELRVEPREAVLVGDSEVDVQTARNSGTMAAAVNYGFGVHDRETHPADIYLERFSDVLRIVGKDVSPREKR